MPIKTVQARDLLLLLLLLLQTTVGESGWINLGENAAELIECDSGEKLLTDWKLFRYCNDPFMIQCLETACAQGKAITIFSFEIVGLHISIN